MSKLVNNPIKDLKGELLKTKNSEFDFDITKELQEIKQEEVKQQDTEIKQNSKVMKDKKQEKEDIRKTKTYRLPQKLIEDMNKVVYMDRELRGNETTLLIKAIENYIYSKDNKELMQQYDELKGNK